MSDVWYDITMSVHPDMLVSPKDKPPEFVRYADMRQGDPVNGTRVRLGCHTGTHVDLPGHVLPESSPSEPDALALCGRARVWEVVGVEPGPLSPDEIPPSGGHDILLLKTPNAAWIGKNAWNPSFWALDRKSAQAVVDSGYRVCGIDYLSIESPWSSGFEAHHVLLKAGIWVLEGLSLVDVPSGSYRLLCLPLRLAVIDALPVRAVLLSEHPASEAAHPPMLR